MRASDRSRHRGIARLARGVIGVTVLSAAFFTTGCGNGDVADTSRTPKSSSTYIPPDELPDHGNLKLRVRWRTDGIIDLNSPIATFLRAVFESDQLAWMASDVDAAFPGYPRANRSTETYAGEKPFFVTSDRRAKIIRDGPIATDTRVAEICWGGRSQYNPREFPPMISESSPPIPEERYLFKTAITYRTDGREPPADQRGNAARPSDNVFGDWYFTGYTMTSYVDDPTGPDPSIECGNMGDLTEPGPSFPGWPTRGV